MAKNIISMFYQTENEETNSSAVNVVLNKEGEALYLVEVTYRGVQKPRPFTLVNMNFTKH